MGRRTVVLVLGILAALALSAPVQAAITVTPGPNTVATPHMFLDFGGSGDTLGGAPITVADTERLDVVKWSGSAGGALGSNLVSQSLGSRSSSQCGSDINENWGMSYGYADFNPPAPVAAGANGTFTPVGTRTVQMDTDRATSCSGFGSIPVRTRYTFWDGGANADMIRIERTWGFTATSPNFGTVALRAYVPRLPLATYNQVIAPRANGTLFVGGPSPTASDPTGGAWRGDWLAQGTAGTPSGLLLLRDPANLEPAIPASDYDNNSSANNSGIALVKPGAGWLAPIKEVEYLCLFDGASWPAYTSSGLPAGCAARPVPIPVSGAAVSAAGAVGAPVTAQPGTWDHADSFAYSWLRCTGDACTPIDGATGQSYTPTDADAGTTLRAVVTGVNANGETDRVTLLAGTVVAGPPKPQPSPAPAAATAPTSITQVVAGLPSVKGCLSRRNFRIRIKQPAGVTITKAVVRVNGKAVATRKGARVTAPVDLRGLPKGRYTVKVTVTFASGKTLSGTRKYRTCAPRRRSR